MQVHCTMNCKDRTHVPVQRRRAEQFYFAQKLCHQFPGKRTKSLKYLLIDKYLIVLLPTVGKDTLKIYVIYVICLIVLPTVGF